MRDVAGPPTVWRKRRVDVARGESVGYGTAYVADAPVKVATVAAGYADGLIRAMGGHAQLLHHGTALPVLGRVSMDLITVDVSALEYVPEHLQLIGPEQTVDTVASWAG